MSTSTIVLEGNGGDTGSDLLARAPAVIEDHVRALRETGLPAPA